MKYFFLIAYTLLFKHFPSSSFPVVGDLSKKLRYICGKRVFKSCGKNVNIERGASFGKGFELEIGDNSGLGRYCHVPSNIKIGKDVMMAPNVFVFHLNHSFQNTEIPMRTQGVTNKEPVVIEDDVWIGRGVYIMPGKKIKKGSIVAAGTVLTKNFPEYSIIGGNPSRFIKSRKKKLN
jgi:maltose O-acetyltransferase